MIIYGRNPVREALRGRRTVRRIWATKNAQREDWLPGSGVSVELSSAGEIEQRYVDLLEALRWFIDERRADEALRLASALAPFWMVTKRLDEGSRWSGRALESAGGNDLNRGEGSRYHLQLEINDFWQRREAELEQLARDLAQEAVTGQVPFAGDSTPSRTVPTTSTATLTTPTSALPCAISARFTARALMPMPTCCRAKSSTRRLRRPWRWEAIRS